MIMTIKHIKLILIGLFTSISIFGCGEKNHETEQMKADVSIHSHDLSISEHCDPIKQHIVLTGVGAFFIGNNDNEVDDSFGTSYQIFYERFPSVTGESGGVNKLFEVDSCYIQGIDIRQKDNGEGSVILLLARENGYCIEEFEKDGTLLNSVQCSDYLEKTSLDTAIKALPDNGYQIRSEKTIFEIASDGEVQEKAQYSVRADGTYIESKDGNTYEVTTEGIYIVNQNDSLLVEFDAVGIPAYTVCGVYSQEDEIRLLQYYTNGDITKVRLISLPADISEKEKIETLEPKYTKAGKRIITIYCPYGNLAKYLIESQVINGFNMENDSYQVVLQEGSAEKAFTDLLVGNGPDLLLEVTNSSLLKYEKNGLLENMTPYLQSQSLYEDLIPEIAEIYQNNKGEIFSLPQALYLVSIGVPESKANGRDNWTVEEFLDWISIHPNIHTSKQTILQIILQGNMEKYINKQNAQAYFEGDDFKNVLKRIGELPFPVETADDSLYDSFDQGDWVYTYFYTTADIAKYETIMGEPLIMMGLPNDNRRPISPCEAITTLSLLKNSGCKEGAMEFLQYWIEYPKQEVIKAEKNGGKTDGKISVLKSIRDEEVQLSLGTGSFSFYSGGQNIKVEYEITEEHVAKLETGAARIVKDTEIDVTARSIIYEEVASFFQGDKDINDVGHIIQSRVLNMLNE